ncbi:ABC transporter ATP-binding protein [Paenibacillus glufosinatiresistens]|uniref:ABC transporter ATP-binding protein n=1 Tax=Paenibacillus glufosinatiresistens TaxID=3070657 RepID=UPI00286EAEFC|nr:ABC transporter ATP-binding protein [Paenibacillus sp. YX.27]
MTTLLRTDRLIKTFDGKEAVKDISMTIRQGEIYGFLGPNGAGKTTVMKMITGLVRPSAGEIEFLGNPVRAGQSLELLKRMGCIIEYPVFYDRLSGRENLELHGEYMGYYNPEAVDNALSAVGLDLRDSRPVKQYSLGMKQRLGIARAMMTRPELLILDEPINGLDPVGIREMRELFRRLSRDYGMTLLISSHILGEIEQIADTIGVIRSGRLVREVAMEEVRGRDADYIELVTPDTSRALAVLERKLGLGSYKLAGERTIRIYDSATSLQSINRALVEADVPLDSFSRKSQSLEDYFMELIRGGDVA